MSDKVFVDTNVLIYAHDVDAGNKHLIAAKILKELRKPSRIRPRQGEKTLRTIGSWP